MRRLGMILLIVSLASLGFACPARNLSMPVMAGQHVPGGSSSALILVHDSAAGSSYPDCASIYPDGTGYRVLSRSVDPYDPYAGYDPICNYPFIAALSPDGSRWLGVFSYAIDGNPDRPYDLSLDVRDREGKNLLSLVSSVSDSLGRPAWHWQVTWMPDSQHVLFWDQDEAGEEGPAGYLNTGRVRLLGLSPTTNVVLAAFSDGLTLPATVMTPDGLPALAIAPDGERVLFRSGQVDHMGLYSIRLDGSGLDTLVDSGHVASCISWSPDSRRVVFEYWQDSSSTIQTINPDGSGLVTLAEGRVPAWSPDGQLIAFSCPHADRTQGLCLVDPDGSNLQELPTGYVGEVHAPYWSPDGRRIAFVGQSAAPAGHDSRSETHDLVVFDLTTGHASMFFFSHGAYVVDCVRDSVPVRWSPDSAWILHEAITAEKHAGAIERGDDALWYICDLNDCRALDAVASVGDILYARWMPVR